MAGQKWFNNTERVLLAIGIGMLCADQIAILDRAHYSRLALRHFDESREAMRRTLARPEVSEVQQSGFSGWAPSEVEADEQGRPSGMPLAVLRIDRLDMRVPVFEGTDQLVLNRGAGWIPGTARPGDAGNVGIAGHRDTFFRSLRNISRGDTIEFSTADLVQLFTVDQIEIVNPDDVGVLRPRVSSLTLVTCYPFNFIGRAPQRFIVHAAMREGSAAAPSTAIRMDEADDSNNRREGK